MSNNIDIEELQESVYRLLIEKDRFRQLWKELSGVCLNIESKLFSIGGPLNENSLGFNNKQLHFIQKIADEVRAVSR